jgi:uncharacterized protein YoaH (UPF0181 family)
MKYDPLVAPDPELWLGTDEVEKMNRVLDYHRQEGIELPSEETHAAFHTTIENQIAMGDETPVAEKIQRLMEEGLDRHDAIHAVGAVLAGHIWELMHKKGRGTANPNDAYFAEVRALTAQKWIDEYLEE